LFSFLCVWYLQGILCRNSFLIMSCYSGLVHALCF
jgi:hypothetical protein